MHQRVEGGKVSFLHVAGSMDRPDHGYVSRTRGHLSESFPLFCAQDTRASSQTKQLMEAPANEHHYHIVYHRRRTQTSHVMIISTEGGIRVDSEVAPLYRRRCSFVGASHELNTYGERRKVRRGG